MDQLDQSDRYSVWLAERQSEERVREKPVHIQQLPTTATDPTNSGDVSPDSSCDATLHQLDAILAHSGVPVQDETAAVAPSTPPAYPARSPAGVDPTAINHLRSPGSPFEVDSSEYDSEYDTESEENESEEASSDEHVSERERDPGVGSVPVATGATDGHWSSRSSDGAAPAAGPTRFVQPLQPVHTFQTPVAQADAAVPLHPLAVAPGEGRLASHSTNNRVAQSLVLEKGNVGQSTHIGSSQRGAASSTTALAVSAPLPVAPLNWHRPQSRSNGEPSSIAARSVGSSGSNQLESDHDRASTTSSDEEDESFGSSPCASPQSSPIAPRRGLVPPPITTDASPSALPNPDPSDVDGPTAQAQRQEQEASGYLKLDAGTRNAGEMYAPFPNMSGPADPTERQDDDALVAHQPREKPPLQLEANVASSSARKPVLALLSPPSIRQTSTAAAAARGLGRASRPSVVPSAPSPVRFLFHLPANDALIQIWS